MEAPASSPDTRNKEWRDQNRGLSLLQSMGWSEGQAVGKRQRRQHSGGEAIATSSEGLRLLKRPDQLGLGAPPTAASASSNQVHHVQEFSDLLQSLASTGTTANTNEKKEKKKKKSRDKAAQKKLPHLPTNKRTHTKVRQAKFQSKSAEDYKCIFANRNL